MGSEAADDFEPVTAKEYEAPAVEDLDTADGPACTSAMAMLSGGTRAAPREIG